MAKNKVVMKKQEYYKAVAEATDMNVADVIRIHDASVDTIFKTTSDMVATDKDPDTNYIVRTPWGGMGTRFMAAGEKLNGATGKTYHIDERQGVVFAPSTAIRTLVNTNMDYGINKAKKSASAPVKKSA